MHATDIIKAVIEDIIAQPNASIADVVQLHLRDVSQDVRSVVNDAIHNALLKPNLGQGELFQLSVLETAQSTINRLHHSTQMKQPQRSKERNKRYVVGDKLNVTATLGLQPTKQHSTSCSYQFSRRTNRQDIIDVPDGTEVIYAGSMLVYDNEPSSKRMIFTIAKGTPVMLNGNMIELSDEIRVAGVVNHIDPDEEYNVRLKMNATKRADKAGLRARVISLRK